MKRKEVRQLEQYLNVCCFKATYDKQGHEREELKNEMWLWLLEKGELDKGILEGGKIRKDLRKKIFYELMNKRRKLFPNKYENQREKAIGGFDSDKDLKEIPDEDSERTKVKQGTNEYRCGVMKRSKRITTYEDEHNNYVNESFPHLSDKQTEVVDYLIRDYARYKRKGNGEKQHVYVEREAGVKNHEYKRTRNLVKNQFYCMYYRPMYAPSSVRTDSLAQSYNDKFSSAKPFVLPNAKEGSSQREKTNNNILKISSKERSSAADTVSYLRGNPTDESGRKIPEKSEINYELDNNIKACEWLKEKQLLNKFRTLDDVERFLNWAGIETRIKEKNEKGKNGDYLAPREEKVLFIIGESGCCGKGERVQGLCNEPPTSYFCWSCDTKKEQYSCYPNSFEGFLLSLATRYGFSCSRDDLLLPVEQLERALKEYLTTTVSQ